MPGIAYINFAFLRSFAFEFVRPICRKTDRWQATGNSREFGLLQINVAIRGNFTKIQIFAFSRHFCPENDL